MGQEGVEGRRGSWGRMDKGGVVEGRWGSWSWWSLVKMVDKQHKQKSQQGKNQLETLYACEIRTNACHFKMVEVQRVSRYVPAFSRFWQIPTGIFIFYVEWNPSSAFFFLGVPLAFFLCRLGPFNGIFGFQSPTWHICHVEWVLVPLNMTQL